MGLELSQNELKQSEELYSPNMISTEEALSTPSNAIKYSVISVIAFWYSSIDLEHRQSPHHGGSLINASNLRR